MPSFRQHRVATGEFAFCGFERSSSQCQFGDENDFKCFAYILVNHHHFRMSANCRRAAHLNTSNKSWIFSNVNSRAVHLPPNQPATNRGNFDDSVAYAVGRSSSRAPVFSRPFHFMKFLVDFFLSFDFDRCERVKNSIQREAKWKNWPSKRSRRRKSSHSKKMSRGLATQSKLEILAMRWQRCRHYHCLCHPTTISWAKLILFLLFFRFSASIFFSAPFVYWRLPLCLWPVRDSFYLPYFPDHYFNSCDHFSISTVSFRFFAW